ncbi:MBL fold metallo-hydrolase [Dendrosporobacter sp. 1207_IL3150]|uniref:MBL fold metallo-hydrolase n=1 Tax=Dendrosporobacter sp. 1207_IL3150 TaxID=3084054 RepID=UPI002FDAE5D4
MQVHVLASGSTGNATFIKMGNTKMLVDAGISARRIKNSLAELGTAVEELDGIFITHEHRDHINGLPTLTKKYKLPVYAKAATFDSMYCREILPESCCKVIGDSIDISGVKVEPFSISHDAADPVGYSLYHQNLKCSVATDIGFVTDSVKKAISYSDVLVFESNHDVDLLKNGAYPWHLKRRIMSNRGHLSNTDAAWTIARMARQKHTKVFLAHLSQENNRPEIAENTVRNILTEQGCELNVDIDIRLTYPDKTASLTEG